jgi:hypothetical protein
MSKEMPPHGNRKYPWDKWQNGRIHVAKRGEDFEIDVEEFRKSVNVRASKVGMKATTRVNGDTVTFRFWKPAPSRKTAKR